MSKPKQAANNPGKAAPKGKTASGARKADAWEFKVFETKQTKEMMENAMSKGKIQFEKLARDAGLNGKEQMDAFLKSGNILFKGYEDAMKTWMGWAQSSAEKNAEAAKALMGCKTLNELAELQSRLAQESFDDFMQGVTKLSELGVKIANDAFSPLNDQISKTVKKAGESLAA